MTSRSIKRTVLDLPSDWHMSLKDAAKKMEKIKCLPDAFHTLGPTKFLFIDWAAAVAHEFAEPERYPIHPMEEVAICLVLQTAHSYDLRYGSL
jgi:hypothetical protein